MAHLTIQTFPTNSRVTLNGSVMANEPLRGFEKPLTFAEFTSMVKNKGFGRKLSDEYEVAPITTYSY